MKIPINPVVDMDAGTESVYNPRKAQIAGRKKVAGVGDKTYVIRNVYTGKLVGRAKKQYYGQKRAIIRFRGKPKQVSVKQITKKGLIEPYRTRKGWRRGYVRR